MLSLKDIKGQDNAVKFLENCLASGRTPNAFLFSGPEGVGRAMAARAFIAGLFSSGKDMAGAEAVSGRVSSGSHPDVMWVKPEKNKYISIDDARKAKEFLSLKPYEAPYTVAVLEDAHMMKAESANALLKVLEEPPFSSLIILISSRKDLILPTVASRCFELRFTRLPLDITQKILVKAAGLTDGAARFLASFSQGSAGDALSMIKEGLLERRRTVIQLLKRAMSMPDAACLSWDGEAKDVLIEDIDISIMLLRDAVLYLRGITAGVIDREGAAELVPLLPSREAEKKAYDIVSELSGLRKMLIGNANAKLVSQAMNTVVHGK
ncbi:MAG: DNA polymerase III subunit delta' [Candidatus Omnitrophica bacterium]|nr:DNA polymerase III subunit delta' [Candidatus Omnitrophota bacterium]